jgi:Ca2+:H+ antiporter
VLDTYSLIDLACIGVVLLHLLLVPGCSFLVHGARIWSQDLHPHNTELNQSLLVMGSLTLLVPAAYFAALDRGVAAEIGAAESIVNDTTRGNFLRISRGVAFILLVV